VWPRERPCTSTVRFHLRPVVAEAGSVKVTTHRATSPTMGGCEHHLACSLRRSMFVNARSGCCRTPWSSDLSPSVLGGQRLLVRWNDPWRHRTAQPTHRHRVDADPRFHRPTRHDAVLCRGWLQCDRRCVMPLVAAWTTSASRTFDGTVPAPILAIVIGASTSEAVGKLGIGAFIGSAPRVLCKQTGIGNRATIDSPCGGSETQAQQWSESNPSLDAPDGCGVHTLVEESVGTIDRDSEAWPPRECLCMVNRFVPVDRRCIQVPPDAVDAPTMCQRLCSVV